MVGSRAASIVLPVPGLPIINMMWTIFRDCEVSHRHIPQEGTRRPFDAAVEWVGPTRTATAE
jgi:hypothetical protein